MAKSRTPIAMSKYSYEASTGKYIEPHLETHGVYNPQQPPAIASSSQRVIDQFLGVGFAHPKHQAFAAEFAAKMNHDVLNVKIMMWLVAGNLPFRVVENPEFRSFITAINIGVTLPSRKTIVHLVEKEYHRALPAVRSVLQSSLRSIHFTFDGWTFR
jgi:hypothetical protein